VAPLDEEARRRGFYIVTAYPEMGLEIWGVVANMIRKV